MSPRSMVDRKNRTALESLASPTMKAPPNGGEWSKPTAASPVITYSGRRATTKKTNGGTQQPLPPKNRAGIATLMIEHSPLCVKKKMHKHAQRAFPAKAATNTVEKPVNANMEISGSAEQACLTLARMKTRVDEGNNSNDIKPAATEEAFKNLDNTTTLGTTMTTTTTTTTTTTGAFDDTTEYECSDGAKQQPNNRPTIAAASKDGDRAPGAAGGAGKSTEASGADYKESFHNNSSDPTESSDDVETMPDDDDDDADDGIMQAAEGMWTALMTAGTDNDIVGYRLNSSDGHEDGDDMEPIPYSLLVGGAPVDADDSGATATAAAKMEGMVLSPAPFGMTREEFLSDLTVERGKPTSVLEQLRHLQHTAIGTTTPSETTHKKAATRSSTGSKKRTMSDTSKEKTRTTRSKKRKTKRKASAASEATLSTPLQDMAGSVGPDTWQMMVLYRMIVFLEQSPECEHAQHTEVFRTVVAKCKAQYGMGNQKYYHLPGAIFEEMVEIIGGPAFLQIYLAAKTFDHPRIEELSHDSELLVAGRDKLSAVSTTAGRPNLLQVSVAYGYHLSQQSTAAGEGDRSLKEKVEQAANEILNLSEAARTEFWASKIDPSILRHTSSRTPTHSSGSRTSSGTSTSTSSNSSGSNENEAPWTV